MPIELKTVTDSSGVNLERHVLSMLYDSVPGGVLVSYYRPDFPLYYIDDRMLRYLNYESQEEFAAATDNRILSCIEPEDRESLTSEIAGALRTGTRYGVTYRMLCRDGDYIWIYEKGRLVTLPDGEQVLICICLDVTGQMEAQTEFQTLAECSLGGIFKAQMDHQFTLIYANDCYYALHGCSRDQLRNDLNNGAAHLVHPDDLEWIDRRLRQAADRGDAAVSFAYRIVQPTGEIRWLNMSGAFSRRQGMTFLSGMVIDITRQKELEQLLSRRDAPRSSGRSLPLYV